MNGLSGLSGFSPMQGSLDALSDASSKASGGLGKMRFGKADDTEEAKVNAGNVLQQFSSALNEQMKNINALDADANDAKQTYAVGGDIQLHDVMIASEKADLAMQLAMQVRNKAVAAYQEISRMAI